MMNTDKLILIVKDKWSVLLSFSLCIFVAFWFITYFSSNLIVEENFGCYFDVLGKSLMSGKLDVPAESIGAEAFVSNGKYYGYFGIFPAVIRIVLNWIFPSMFCKWSRLIMLVFYSLSLIISYMFYLKFKSKAKNNIFGDCVYILLIGLGSTLLFLSSKSFIYHESIIVAGCLSLWSYYFFSSFVDGGKEKYFLLSAFLAFFAIQARVNVGLGNMFLLGLYAFISITTLSNLPVWPRNIIEYLLPNDSKISRLRMNILVIVVLGLVTIVTLCGINYIKFGNYFSFTPLDKHAQYIDQPYRMEKMKKYYNGSLLSLSNIVHNGRYYFGVGGFEFLPTFPYVFSQGYRSFIPQLNSVDLIEYNVSLMYNNPLIYLSMIIGCIFIFTKKKYIRVRLSLLGSLVTIFLTLATIAVSQRYIHDFFPPIVITSSIGFIYIYEYVIKRRFLKFVMLIVVIVALYVNFAITLNYQRKFSNYQNYQINNINIWLDKMMCIKNRTVNGFISQDCQEFNNKLNNVLSIIKNEVLVKQVTNDDKSIPKSPVSGQIWEFGKNVFWYNGQRWLPIVTDKNIRYRHYKLMVAFDPGKMKDDVYEPLISEAIVNKGNFTVVKKKNGKLIFLQDKGWTGIFLESQPVDFPEVESVLDIIYDRYNNVLSITMNDKKIIENEFIFEEMGSETLSFGKNVYSAAFQSKFSGMIKEKYLNGYKIGS